MLGDGFDGAAGTRPARLLRRGRWAVAGFAWAVGLASSAAATPVAEDGSRVERVAAFDAAKGEAAESIAIDAAGTIYVSLITTGEIRRIGPDGAQDTLAALPIGAPAPAGQGALGGLALDPAGNVYAAGSSDPAAAGVWRVSPNGRATRVAALLPEGQPNGLAFDGAGNLYVADSAGGAVYRIAAGSSATKPWLRHPLLAVAPGGISAGYADLGLPEFPAPNGLKVFRGDLYAANSDTSDIVPVPIAEDGAAGEPSVYAGGIPIDDFALDLAGNLYATTDLFNTVVRNAPDGERRTVLAEEDDLDRPSAVAFGTAPGDRTRLYVTNLAFFNPDPATKAPGVLAVDVGVEGYPLPHNGPAPGDGPATPAG